MKRHAILIFVCAGSVFACASCQIVPCCQPPFANITQVVAVVHPTQGNACRGVVRFTQEGADAVKIVAVIEGLKPNSKHGFHIHQFGDCSALNGKSAGGHYNPAGHAHGRSSDPKHHAGDLGNLQADASGKARYEEMILGINIAGGKNPILGRGVIIHAKPDDFGQPTGNAGSRIGCGVIGVAKGQ